MGTLILSILVFLFSCTDIIIGVHSPKSLSLLEKPFGDQVFPVVPEGASAVSGGNQQQKAWADPLPEAPSLSEVVVGNTNFDPSAGPRDTNVNDEVPLTSNNQAISNDLKNSSQNERLIVPESPLSQVIYQPSMITSTNVGTPVASHFQVTGNKIQNNLQKAGSKAFAAEEAQNVLQASLSKTKMSPGVILLDQIPPSIATMTESIPGMAPVSSENEIPAFDPNAIWVDFSSSNLLADQPPFGSFVKQLPLVKSPRPNFSESSSIGFGFNMQPPFALSQPTTTPAAPSAISMQQLQRQVIKNTKALLRRLSVSRRLQFMRTIQTLSPQQKKLFFTKIAQLSIGN